MQKENLAQLCFNFSQLKIIFAQLIVKFAPLKQNNISYDPHIHNLLFSIQTEDFSNKVKTQDLLYLSQKSMLLNSNFTLFK